MVLCKNSADVILQRVRRLRAMRTAEVRGRRRTASLDPIGFSNAIRASTDWNGVYWELFIFIGLCFFICCYGMSRYSLYLERKLRTDHR